MKRILCILALSSLLGACNQSQKDAELLQAKQMAIDSMTQANNQQHIIDSMNAVSAARNERAAERAQENAAASAPVEQEQAPAPHKKGWSGTAKGAVIGAGVGAITGAMVDGKKGEGAIVGGLIGAAAGAGTGAIIDGKKKRKPDQ